MKENRPNKKGMVIKMGTLYVVATPIGNLKDMTERAIETLKKVDIILCEDTRTSLKLLNHFEIKNTLVAYHKFNEREASTKIIEHLKQGKNIALISDAGTPCISDPGYILVKLAKKENINVIGIGGISALITALSVSGLDSNKFTFQGFFPRETKDKTKLIEELKSSSINTHIFYESPKRIIKTLEYLKENLGNVNISVSKELTKLHEQNYYGTIDEVLTKLKENEKTTLGEYTFIIEKEQKQEEKQNLTIEALLIEEIVKNDLSLKEAIDKLNKNQSSLSKKDIYKASLNLKQILEKR